MVRYLNQGARLKCTYRGKDNRKCKNIAMRDSTFCINHRCGAEGCDKSKSSTVKGCSDHPKGKDKGKKKKDKEDNQIEIKTGLKGLKDLVKSMIFGGKPPITFAEREFPGYKPMAGSIAKPRGKGAKQKAKQANADAHAHAGPLGSEFFTGGQEHKENFPVIKVILVVYATPSVIFVPCYPLPRAAWTHYCLPPLCNGAIV